MNQFVNIFSAMLSARLKEIKRETEMIEHEFAVYSKRTWQVAIIAWQKLRDNGGVAMVAWQLASVRKILFETQESVNH